MTNREIFDRVKGYLLGNLWRAVAIMIIIAIIPGLVNSIVGGVLFGNFVGQTANTAGFTFDQFLGPLVLQGLVIFITWVIASLLTIGEKWAYVEMIDSDLLEIPTIFKSFTKRPGRNIWHNILQYLLIFLWTALGIIGAGAVILLVIGVINNYIELTLGSLILTAIIAFLIFAVAAVIWSIAVQFWFVLSEFVLYDEPAFSAYQALRTSRQLMKGHKWQLLRLAVRIFLPLIFLTIALPVVLVLFVFIIQDSIWLLGLIAFLSIIGIVIYSLLVNIRWKAALAIFYRTLTD